MARTGKADFGFDEAFEAQLDQSSGCAEEPRRSSTMGSIIRDTAQASRRRFEEAPDIERRKLKFAARMAELEERQLDLRLLDVDAIRTDGFTRDRKDVNRDDLQELKASIRANGLSNPIRVDEADDGALLLNQGLRRVIAFRELRDEFGAEQFQTIPALVSPLQCREASYRRMVDENLVRAEISFGELGLLALAYADEMGVESEVAVTALYSSLHKTKRSFIRKAVKVLSELGDVLEHPEAHGRRALADLANKLDDPAFTERLKSALMEMPGRSAPDEVKAIERASRGLVPGGTPARRRASVEKFTHKPGGSTPKFDVQVAEDRLVISSRGIGKVDRDDIIAAIETYLVKKS